MDYVGGLRLRLIKDNLENRVRSDLQQLGWFDPGRQHMSVTLRSEPNNEPIDSIEPNAISIDASLSSEFEWEMGSYLTVSVWNVFIDVMAESHSVGLHLSGDIKDTLQGKFTTSIPGNSPFLRVFDLTMTTPTEIFVCEIENVTSDKAPQYANLAHRHWWSINFDLLDYYSTE